MTLDELVKQSHELAKEKGWWDERPTQALRICAIPEKLMLVVSELSEALEEYRSGNPPHWTYREGPGGKPEGFPIELADAFIRLADLCGALDLDIEDAIETKHAYNEQRPHRHGNKVV
jgi:NTP pyrophosphatase (non-canonical NTP hydrolase)